MNRPLRRFILRLCKLLGKTQWELIHGPGRLSTEELIEWLTEYQIEPFENDDDLRFATLSTMVAKSFLSSEADDLFKLFMPKRTNISQEPEVEQTIDSTLVMLQCGGFTVVQGVRDTSCTVES